MKHTQTDGEPKTSVKKKARDSTAAAPDSKVRSSAKPNGEDRDEIIRRTAYAYFEARGCTDGHALEDWLQAQQEVDRLSTPS